MVSAPERKPRDKPPIAEIRQEIGYVPYFRFIDTTIVPPTWRRDDAITKLLRLAYFDFLYWAWFAGTRSSQGYPQVVISPKRYLSSILAWDEDTPVEVVSKKTFFRWIASLEERNLIRRKRVKDGIRLTLRLPKEVLKILTEMAFAERDVEMYRQAWEHHISNKTGDDYYAQCFGVPMVESGEDRDTISEDRDRKDRDIILDHRDRTKAAKVHKGINDTRPVTKGKEKKELRETANNYVSFPAVTGPTGSGLGTLEEILAKGKARSAGKTRYAVTKHKPAPTNPFTRDYSVRWWQQQVREHLGIPSAMPNLAKVGNNLTQDWEPELWQEWYRVMDVMIRKWPDFLRYLLSKEGGGTRLTDKFPPYHWRNSQWWNKWTSWAADQMAMEKHVKPKPANGKKSFL